MFIGRDRETRLIQDRLADRSKAQLIILYGRRRVGKSTLIRNSLKNQKKVLFFEGIQGEPTKIQIDQFLNDLAGQTGSVKLAARNWREVFQGLGQWIQKGRWVIVLDEFPWMAAGRSRLVAELKLYWDRWAARNKDLVFILCGSVSSFMTKHLVHSKALHNRKTLEICLAPLSPKESGRFIAKRSPWEKAQLYMSLGGVPKYLEQIDPNISLEKNLNRLCFCADGFFVNEFETLFKEQFRSIKTYQTIVQQLAKSPASLTELAAQCALPKGGGLQSHLNHLIQAQFVKDYSPFRSNNRKRTKTKVYKLADPFLIFYFRYIHPNREIILKNTGENLFRAIAGESLHQYWGFAFERLCEDAFAEILNRMGVSLTDIVNMGPHFRRKTPGQPQPGFQIDCLIRRRDGVWMVLEYKYTQSPVGAEIINEVEDKVAKLDVTPAVSLEKVLISAAGATSSVQEANYFNHILTLRDIL